MRAWLARQRYLVDYTLSAMLRRKGKNLALLTVYGLVVFLLASAMLFSHALRREAAVVLEGSPEVVVQRMVAGRHDLLPAGHLDALRRIKGVQRAEGRLWGYHFDPTVSANYTLMVPRADAPEPGSIRVGAGIARARGAGIGDVLALRGADGSLFSFKVAGILSERSELVSADLALLSEADFRRFAGMPAGVFTDAAMNVRNPAEVRTVAQKVVTALPDVRPILRTEILRTYDSVFTWREGIMLLLLAGAVLAFAILAWEKAAGLSAEERREIGVLKAVGWETADVIRMKGWEGGMVSLAAFLLGYLGAYVHVFHFASPLFAPVLKGWAVLYPDFALVPVIDGFQVATLFLFTVVPYTAATIVPVWRAAITDPDAVMR